MLPLVSAALILFFGKRTPGKGAVYGIVAVGAAFLFSLGAVALRGGRRTVRGKHRLVHDRAALHWRSGILVDGLTGIMLVVVTSISLCVHIYSLGYMHGDERSRGSTSCCRCSPPRCSRWSSRTT